MELYHFLASEHALAAIRDDRVKVSKFDNLNDPFELFAADLATRRLRDTFRFFKGEFTADYAILCCSKSWTTTLLWSHYARNHTGMALILEVPDNKVAHIDYSEARIPITLADISKPIKDGINDPLARVFRTKSRDWAYEDEARVYFSRPGLGAEEDERLYARFGETLTLKGVILGPLCEVPLAAVEALVSDDREFTVRKARLAFRSFRVVNDLSFKGRRNQSTDPGLQGGLDSD